MSYDHALDYVPIWVFLVIVVLITLLPLEGGRRLGGRRRRAVGHEPDSPIGDVVGATLALLGFMVALTLGAAVARFDARKEAFIDGVNAIETAYRNALLIPEPHRSEVRRLLREYVEIRLDMPKYYDEPERLAELDARVRTVQRALWSHAEALAREDRNSEIYALFTASLNEVFKVHNKRVILGAKQRIPLMVWAVLMVVTIITMFGVGFQFGLAATRSWIADLMLALTFASVMTIIFDLDQAGRGLINVDQQPMYELNERMQAEE
jgi:hypothetical protein